MAVKISQRKKKKMFEIFLMDLLPEKRKEFLKMCGCWEEDFNVEDPTTFPNNWDTIPLAIFYTEYWDEDEDDLSLTRRALGGCQW